MDIAVDSTQAAERSAVTEEGPGAGESGEGARSALEKLIQQERKRDAQLPRDRGGGRPEPADRRP